MIDFAILADVTCDLCEEIRSEYDIDFVPGHLVVEDSSGVLDVETKLVWDFDGRHSFYEKLGKNPKNYKTSPPNRFAFEKAFERYAQNNMPVLCLTISSQMSGTYNFACSGKDAVLEKYPDAKIEIIDTKRFGGAMGLMAVNASIMRSAKIGFEEVAKKLNETKFSYHQMGWLDDLAFAAKQGRINNAAAFFGTLLGIKPLGDIDTNGMTTPIGKAKGEQKAYAAICEYISRTMENPAEQVVIVCHTDREKNADVLKSLIEEKIKPKRILMTTCFPSCGVSIGAGLAAVYYTGKPISENLVDEKKLMAEILAK